MEQLNKITNIDVICMLISENINNNKLHQQQLNVALKNATIEQMNDCDYVWNIIKHFINDVL